MKKLIVAYSVVLTIVIALALILFARGNILTKIIYGMEFYNSFLDSAVFLLVCLCFYVPTAFLFGVIESNDYSPNKTFHEWREYLKIDKSIASLIFLCALLLFLPSTNTVYLMLGSEISEEVVSTDIGKDIISHVNDIIRETIEDKTND